MNSLFTPRGFLQVGGVILLLVGLLGYFGILIGPTQEQSIFGEFWYFDNAENLVHTVLGVAGLAAVFTFPAVWQRYLVMFLGVAGLAAGLYSLAISQTLLGAVLQNPADTVLHLVVGAWALYAVFGGNAQTKK